MAAPTAGATAASAPVALAAEAPPAAAARPGPALEAAPPTARKPPPPPLPAPFAPAGGADSGVGVRSVTLGFRSAAVEADFLREVAAWRWPVLVAVFLFDCVTFAFRLAAKLAGGCGSGQGAGVFADGSLDLPACAAQQPLSVLREMGSQLANMAGLYALIAALNRRARRSCGGAAAACQEEGLLAAAMALAICNLLASLRADNAADYVYMSYFLIATTTFLKIRWWVGTGMLAIPMLAAHAWHGSPAAGAAIAAAARRVTGDWGPASHSLRWLLSAATGGTDTAGAAAESAGDAGSGGFDGSFGSSPAGILPADAVVHITVAWAVGGLMAYLSDWYRRQMYAHARLATAAHEKELREARARVAAERELAAAQQQAAQRALSVAREKAANEAKSEFMSLMCHEVRTPLNGCLASAEMLLETPLQEEQRELAKTIRVSGSILLSTVSNFLDFFKLEAGKRLDTVQTEVLLTDLVGDVYCIIEAMCGRGGAVALLPPDLSRAPVAPVLCDADRLRGVLLNLATNAAKFTRRGHICLRVREVPPEGYPSPPPGRAGITIRPGPVANAGSAQGDDAAWSGGDGGDVSPGQQQGQARLVRECSFEQLPVSPTSSSSDNSGDSSGTPPEAAVAAALPPPEPITFSAPRKPASWRAAAAAADGVAAGLPAGAAMAGSSILSRRRYSGGETVGAVRRWLLFEVEDTGCGIAPEGLHGLFKEYVQGTDDEMRRPRSKGGTGLGLSICSKQVAVLGGTIGAHSRPGEGSTFWFLVPALVLQGIGVPPPMGADVVAAAASAAQAAVEQHQRLQRKAQMLRQQQALPAHLEDEPAGGSGDDEGASSSRPGHLHSQQQQHEQQQWQQQQHHQQQQQPVRPPGSSESLSRQGSSNLGPPSGGGGLVPTTTGGVGGGRRSSLDASRLAGLNVLLAEDNAINQLVAKKMLTGLGMHVSVAANGAEAVRAVSEAAAAGGPGFAVVLMDLLMPVMDGLEATAAIRAKGLTVPIVAMTANAGDKDRLECEAAGMQGFLPKPVLRDQLAGAILAAIKQPVAPPTTPLPDVTAAAAAACSPDGQGGAEAP